MDLHEKRACNLFLDVRKGIKLKKKMFLNFIRESYIHFYCTSLIKKIS